MVGWEEFRHVDSPPDGWDVLPVTAWATIFAWVAGPTRIRVQVFDDEPFPKGDEWIMEWLKDDLVEAGVPVPEWVGWEFYYDGDFERSSFMVNESLAPGVPVTPEVTIGAMAATRHGWV